MRDPANPVKGLNPRLSPVRLGLTVSPSLTVLAKTDHVRMIVLESNLQVAVSLSE